MSDLVGIPEDRFSHNEAQLIAVHGKATKIFAAVSVIVDTAFTIRSDSHISISAVQIIRWLTTE